MKKDNMRPVKVKEYGGHRSGEAKKKGGSLHDVPSKINKGVISKETGRIVEDTGQKSGLRKMREADRVDPVHNVKAYMAGDTITVIELEESPVQYITRIRKGVTGTGLRNVMKRTAITLAEMAEIMDLTQAEIKTISGSRKLDQNQSEKAVLIERLYLRGEQIFEDAKAFRIWMDSKVKSLGNNRPKDYLDTVSGINLVADEMERLAYGVFS